MYSEKEWDQWINNYLNKLKTVYDNDPERIKEDYGNESKVSSDYKGRAILEILQNADDAQVPEREITDKVGSPEVFFIIREGVLYCANGGHQVSMDGLNSICRLSHSPKEVKDKKRVTIGEKGLGFKSVLSFSETPEIHSGNLHCCFSRKKSYEFISTTRQFKKITDKVSVRHVPLLRVPNVIPAEDWKKDETLVNLLKRCATVIKLPLSYDLKSDEIDDELTQIESTILLFLRHLEKLSIQRLDGVKYSFAIKRGEHKKVDENTEKIQCSIHSDEIKTDWTVLQHFGSIPSYKLIGLGEGWEEMDTYYVSFALQKENDHYIPLSTKTKNRIRVYFPTDEDFYMPLLFHATFFTGISRKTINSIIPYNSFIVTEGVKVFLKYVLELVYSENKEDPGYHLDFFTPNIRPEDLIGEEEDENIGKIFIRALLQEVKSTMIIPQYDGELRPIGKIQVLNRPKEEWEDWYGVLGKEKCIDLRVVHLCCRKENRFRLIEYLDPSKISNEDLVEALNDVPDELKSLEWCVDTYLLLYRLHKGQSWRERERLENKYGKLRIIKLSDGALTSSEGEYKVFMPPGSTTILQPPDWLRIKFVHPKIITLLQRKTNEKRREKILSEYLDYFGVKQYRAREVVRECVTKDLNPYWAGQDTDVNPNELLLFLFNLQKDELRPDETPESQLERYLVKIPVPSYDPDRNPKWSPAGETYASSDWSDNGVLEALYSFDKKSRFIREKEYFEGEIDKWEIFLKWLGVSWTPRLITLSTRMEYSQVSKPKVPQKLSNWSNYSSVIEVIEYDDGEGTIDDGRISLQKDYVLDRFFEICEDPIRQKILLNLLARNPALIDNIPNATISFIPYKKKVASEEKLDTNYQEWCLRDTKWLYGHGFSERFKPSDLCIPIEGLLNVLGDYARYVDYKTEINSAEWVEMKSFLIRIGLTDSLEEFSLSQWYSILLNIPTGNEKINEDTAQKIRGIYRRLVRTNLIPETKTKNEEKIRFIEKGKVLVTKSGEYLFVYPSEAYYVDKLDLLPKFEKYVPCFQVEAKRSKRVRELFEIAPLSEAMVIDPEFGTLEKELFESFNKFFEHSKPYLLARVRSQRADKTDPGRLSNAEIRPVRKIKVKYGLKKDEETIWVYDGEVDSLLYQNDGSRMGGIYLNARLTQNSICSSEDFKKEDPLIQEISDRLAELLDIDLSEAFQLILSRDDPGRWSLLKKSGVTEDILNECKVEIKQPYEESSDEKLEKPIEPILIDTGVDEEKPAPIQKERTEPRKRRIWGDEGMGRFNHVNIEPPVPRETKERGSGGGGGGYAPHQPDPDIRRRTDLAGMTIVKNYEKEKGYYPQDVSTAQQRLDRGDGPGCDVHSFDKDGKLVRKIEVKSSLGEYNKIDFTKNEWETARNKFTGQNFYLYRVSKLDADKYPDGPELLIILDPYAKGLEAMPSGYTIKIDPRKGELIKLAPFVSDDEKSVNEKDAKRLMREDHNEQDNK